MNHHHHHHHHYNNNKKEVQISPFKYKQQKSHQKYPLLMVEHDISQVRWTPPQLSYTWSHELAVWFLTFDNF